MKTKIIKISITIILLLICILLYKLPAISLWRSFNNGVRAFGENNFEQAAVEFNKAVVISDDNILKYNLCISRWADVVKLQQDLKINTINDSSLTVLKKKELMPKIEKAHDALNQLIDAQKISNNYLKKLYYAQGKLFLLEAQPEIAKQSFLKSMSKDKTFTLPQIELVKLKTTDESNFIPELLLNIAEAKPIDIERKWKPF